METPGPGRGVQTSSLVSSNNEVAHPMSKAMERGFWVQKNLDSFGVPTQESKVWPHLEYGLMTSWPGDWLSSPWPPNPLASPLTSDPPRLTAMDCLSGPLGPMEEGGGREGGGQCI